MGGDESTSVRDLTGPLRGTSLETAVLGALDTLEQALQLEPWATTGFRRPTKPIGLAAFSVGSSSLRRCMRRRRRSRATRRIPCMPTSFRQEIRDDRWRSS